MRKCSVGTIKGGHRMSEIEAEIIAKQFEKWDQKQAKHNFIARMERKMYRRDKGFRYSRNPH